MALRAALALSCLCAAATVAAGGVDNCDGRPNVQPIWTGSPEFVANTTHGSRWVAGATDLNPRLIVLHVYGTAYEMGVAQGTLLKKEIQSMLPEVMAYIASQVAPYVQDFPPWLQEIIEYQGVDAALDITYELNKPYIPIYFINETQGIADGSGLEFQDIMRLSMFPELIQAACSMFGAWGQAVSKADPNGSLIQLRALDWGTDGPFQKYPLLVTYHPLAGQGNAFTTLGWAGFVGAITGISEKSVAMSEKVWYDYKGEQSRIGIPWHYLLRDIIQWDEDIDQALGRIASAHRTCAIWIGLGVGPTGLGGDDYRIVQYSYEEVHVFSDKDYPEYEQHVRKPGLCYTDKHTQPSGDPCMPSLFETFYGEVTADVTIRNITAQFQTGDMHIAVFDHGKLFAYVSNASPADSSGKAIPAYDRPFVGIDLKQQWATRLEDVPSSPLSQPILTATL